MSAEPVQLALFGEPRLARAFRAFHEANPRIYTLFCQFAQQAWEAGKRRYSARTIVHRLRWHVEIETRSTDGLKINNNHSAFLSRLYARDFPEHVGLFEQRRSVADAAIGATT